MTDASRPRVVVSPQFLKKGARLTAQVEAACGGGLCRMVMFADAQREGGGSAAVLSLLPLEEGVTVGDGG